MSEHAQSELPRDPDYWDSLARRISDDAANALEAYASAQDVWYAVLDRRAPWLVAASATAMLVIWLGLPAPRDSVAHRWIERSVAPREIAGSLVGGATPPSVDVLLPQFPLPGEDEP